MGISTNTPPGPNTAVTTAAYAFVRHMGKADVKAIILDAVARDTGNTVTTTLRAGLFLGLINETGRYGMYLDAATDGRTVARGILLETVNLLDQNLTAQNTPANMLIRGRVNGDKCFGADANGWTDLATLSNGTAITNEPDFSEYSSSSSLSSSSSSSSSS